MVHRDGASSWEPVWRGQGELRAHAIAGMLEASGVDARLRSSSGSAAAALGMFAADWTLLVRGEDAEEARNLLTEHDEGDNVIAPEEESGLSPGQRRTLQLAVVAIVLLLVVALVDQARG